ncbi:MAG TPA: OB-fold nucleic acid binding domain-containing protein, partial [Streptosporangiaceae bacterium]|nr:OB-fold nucleic acid binding domain-containing protein [Streptosporangiaceae bacterium]
PPATRSARERRAVAEEVRTVRNDGAIGAEHTRAASREPSRTRDAAGSPAPSDGNPPAEAEVTPIGSVQPQAKATVEGIVGAVEIKPVEQNVVLACAVSDTTGELTALFYGRKNIPGLAAGSRIRLHGRVVIRHDAPTMINPAYELLD